MYSNRSAVFNRKKEKVLQKKRRFVEWFWMRRAKVTYLCCQLFGCVDSMWNVLWFMSVLFYSSLVWGIFGLCCKIYSKNYKSHRNGFEPLVPLHTYLYLELTVWFQIANKKTWINFRRNDLLNCFCICISDEVLYAFGNSLFNNTFWVLQ